MGCRRQRRRAGRKVQGTAKAGAARGPARGVRKGRRQKAEGRMKALRAVAGGATRGHRGMRNRRNNEKRTKSDQVNRIKSDQIKSNPAQQNRPVRVTVRAVGSKVARRNLEFGRARWIRGNAERINGDAKGLSGRNTCFIYDTDERGSGLGGNLRLNSLILAYLRLKREKCLRPAFDVQRFELWADEPAKKESASVHSTWPVGCGWKLLFRRPLCFNPREHVSAPNENPQ